MRLHRNLVFTTIDSLMAIFNDAEYANTTSANCGDNYSITNYLSKIQLPNNDSIVFISLR